MVPSTLPPVDPSSLLVYNYIYKYVCICAFNHNRLLSPATHCTKLLLSLSLSHSFLYEIMNIHSRDSSIFNGIFAIPELTFYAIILFMSFMREYDCLRRVWLGLPLSNKWYTLCNSSTFSSLWIGTSDCPIRRAWQCNQWLNSYQLSSVYCQYWVLKCLS